MGTMHWRATLQTSHRVLYAGEQGLMGTEHGVIVGNLSYCVGAGYVGLVWRTPAAILPPRRDWLELEH